ncbi:MAG: lactate racemase domain-containing protein [Isosphaeraceae bacterium]
MRPDGSRYHAGINPGRRPTLALLPEAVMTFPPIARVRQTAPQPLVADIPGTVRKLLLESRLRERVPAGGTIAVGCGSRGITAIPTVAKSAVDTLKEMGYRPFIVAAMGSHGGATSDGQRELLAGYEITPETMGVPVKTEMDAVELGTNPVGLPIYFDRNAYEADGIVLLNRVKPHTDFHATHESGVLKMLVIGLGKQQGASQIHKMGLRGLKEVLPAVGRFLVDNTKFALGVAIVENADDLPAEIVAIEPETIFDVEPRLLARARELMGRLPYDQIDVLMVGELGKNYSGAGMDPNVIGRLMIETQNDFERPVVTRLGVLDASDETHGNIVGIGFADLTTERLVAKHDPIPTQVNILTACCLERGRIPITLPTDRDVFTAALDTCWRVDPSTARLVIIPNTLELKSLWISPALQEETRAHAHLKLETEFQPIPFSADGQLDQEALFPESVRGRRRRAPRRASPSGV